MLDKIKKLLSKEKVEKPSAPQHELPPVAVDSEVATAPKKKKPPKPKKELTPKQLATKKKQPWYDFKLVTENGNPGAGYFEGDFNRYHVEKLREAGYPGTSDDEVVSAWLRSICLSVAKEDEQLLDYLASNRVKSQRNDDGTVEYS